MSKRLSVEDKHLKNNQKYLQVLQTSKPKRRTALILHSPLSGVKAIKYLFRNILKGRITLKDKHKQQLKRHKAFIRKVGNSNLKDGHKALKQKGGGLKLGSILKTVLPLLPTLLL
jgi:hypothetical protein